jgi:hypothetical protein
MLLHQGWSCSVVGMSNMGASAILHVLVDEQARSACAAKHGVTQMTVMVDCIGCANTELDLYDLILKRIIEECRTFGVSGEIVHTLTMNEQHMLELASEVGARSLFGSSMRELAREQDLGLILVLDEFDGVFRGLPVLAFGQLRGARDAWKGRLRFVTATHRPLAEMRADPGSSEFREMFKLSTIVLKPLERDDAERFLAHVAARQLSPLNADHARIALELSGGHPGLLETIYVLLGKLEAGKEIEASNAAGFFLQQEAVRDELDDVLASLNPDERQGLALVATGDGQALGESVRTVLKNLGLLVQDKTERTVVFSPLLAAYGRQEFAYDQKAERGLHCSLNTDQVWVNGAEVTAELSGYELRFVQLLSQKQGAVCKRDDIIDYVYGVESAVTYSGLGMLVKRARAALGEGGKYIKTVHGLGYRLEMPK